jgi:hypothetical protein
MNVTTERAEGFRDLTGQVFGVIRVLHIARRNPLGWVCQCENCGSQFTLSHTLTQYGQCPRGPVACRRPALVEREHGTMTRVFAPPPQEQRPAPVVQFKPSAAALANPAGVKAMLDAEARRKERG